MSTLSKEEKFTMAIDLIKNELKADLFLNQNDHPCITVDLGEIVKTYKIRSKLFWQFSYSLFRLKKLKVSEALLEEIINELDFLCIESGIKKEVSIRVGYDTEGNLLIDNSDDGNTFMQVGQTGFRVITNPSVPFVRSSKQLPLPHPLQMERKDFLEDFSSYFNLKHNSHFLLVLAFTLKLYIKNSGSCVIFVLEGKQDSGKSTASECLKFMIDPTEPLLTIAPKTVEEVVILANSSYFLTYDNLSGISNDLADFLCSVVYGVNYSKRGLYTDDDERRYHLKRDFLFNGIEDLSGRSDLNDRIIEVGLVSIDPQNRKSKSLINEELEKKRPYFLYGIYSLLSDVLKVLPEIRETNLPRMADYARIGLALDKVLGYPENNFIEIYNQAISEKKENTFWSDELCSAIYLYLTSLTTNSGWNMGQADNKELRGTVLQIRDKLFKKGSRMSSYTPKTSRSFAAQLKRIEPLLLTKGIIVKKHRKANAREITIEFQPEILESINKKYESNLNQEFSYPNMNEDSKNIDL